MSITILCDPCVIVGNLFISLSREEHKGFNKTPSACKKVMRFVKKFVFRLYQNVYMKGISRQYAVGAEDLNDGVEISNLKIDGQGYDVNSKKVSNTATNMAVKLDQPLLPGASANISLDWKFNFSKKG